MFDLDLTFNMAMGNFIEIDGSMFNGKSYNGSETKSGIIYNSTNYIME